MRTLFWYLTINDFNQLNGQKLYQVTKDILYYGSFNGFGMKLYKNEKLIVG